MSRQFGRLGDLPADLNQQIPGVAHNNGVSAGSSSIESQQAPIVQAGPLTPTNQATSPKPGTAHPLYKAADYNQIPYVGTGESVLVSTAKNRRYLGIQNLDSSQAINWNTGSAAVTGGTAEIDAKQLWDNTTSPPGNDIYVVAPAGVNFVVIEGT